MTVKKNIRKKIILKTWGEYEIRIETISPFHPFESFEEAKRAAIQFVKNEAIERMKELTYIINFIER